MFFIRRVILLAVLITTVKSDCDSDLLKCLGDFVINMFGDNNATVVKSDVSNDNQTKTDVIYFDLKENLENNTENLFKNISEAVKGKVESKGLFNSELNITKFIDETSNIFLNIFDLKNIQNLFTQEEKEIITSELETVVQEQNLTMETFGELLEEINKDIEIKVNKTKSKIDEEIDEIFNNFAKQFHLDNTNNITEPKTIERIVSKPAISFRNAIDLALKTELNEISDVAFDNSFYDEENSTDYPNIDYVEFYKDTTNEDVVLTTEISEVTTEPDVVGIETTQASCHGNASSVDALVHPWIATIFVKNATSQQFDYICDGAILSDRIIVTAARCLLNGNTSIEATNVLTVLGKTSLLNAGSSERVYRVQSIRVHESFSSQGGVTANDIATITTEDNIIFNANIRTACLIPNHMEKQKVVAAITTAWKISGDLTTVKFDAKSYGDCQEKVPENVFCSTYGNDVTFCPSYGGLNIVKLQDQWFLRGIRSADMTDRRFCTEKILEYTDISKFVQWIGV